VSSVTINQPGLSRPRRLAFQWWWLIWAVAVICIFLCGIGLGIVSSGGPGGQGGWFSQFLSPPFSGADRVTILAVGTDNSSGRGLADTIIVAAVYPRTGEISALSIPRDSRVEVPGMGVRRINSSHALGGMPMTIETVELLLGMPIDRSIEISVPGIVQLVDAIGGVDIDVEKRMYYRDRSQHLTIDLQPGLQHLDGEQAMGYVRFRHDATGDLGRMERQRHFLRAVITQLMKPGNVAQFRKLAEVFVKTVKTDLNIPDLMSLKRLAEQGGPDAIRATSLPGEPKAIGGQSMIELNPDQVRETVNQVLRGQGLSVQVLNGTDVNGLGASVAATLEEAGCDITEIGNAQGRTEQTLVVDHRGRARRAERVADWLGRGVVSAQPDGNNPADVTVIIGRDLAGQTK